MIIEAIESFAGVVSMSPGEVKDVDDETAAALIKANYAKAVEPEKAPAKPKTAKKK